MGSYGAAALVYPLFFFQIFFLDIVPFSWCNCWIFAWLKILIGGFAGCNGWSSYSCFPMIVTLRCSLLVNGFYWDSIFIWVLSWFTCLSLSWNDPLTGTLGGTAEGFDFWIFAYMEDICGILNVFGENSTVSDILSDLLLGVYALWYLYCSITVPMYQTYSPCSAHYARSFGLLWMTICIPGGYNVVQL